MSEQERVHRPTLDRTAPTRNFMDSFVKKSYQVCEENIQQGMQAAEKINPTAATPPPGAVETYLDFWKMYIGYLLPLLPGVPPVSALFPGNATWNRGGPPPAVSSAPTAANAWMLEATAACGETTRVVLPRPGTSEISATLLYPIQLEAPPVPVELKLTPTEIHLRFKVPEGQKLGDYFGPLLDTHQKPCGSLTLHVVEG